MNILMFTNTYKPHVGGVARSVETFAEQFKKRGHKVLIVAPEYQGYQEEKGVIRVPAIQNFNGSDFSIQLPIPFFLTEVIDKFNPDIVHSHHPFLLGDTAQRTAALKNVPLVFTHHTMYEHYTHYVPGDSEAMQRFVVELTVNYCNLCQHIIAPSESVQEVLAARGVTSKISAIPTGIDTKYFRSGRGAEFRKQYRIPPGSRVIGHVGRLAEEKNLNFLTKAAAEIVQKNDKYFFLVIGDGPYSRKMKSIFKDYGLQKRLILAGTKTGRALVNAYHAMDVFVFASKSETQGMVIAEALAAGVPVVALDAPGARETIRSGENGTLLKKESLKEFCAAVGSILNLDAAKKNAMNARAVKSASQFSREACSSKILKIYGSLLKAAPHGRSAVEILQPLMRVLEKEWNLISGKARAAGSVILESCFPALQGKD